MTGIQRARKMRAIVHEVTWIDRGQTIVSFAFYFRDHLGLVKHLELESDIISSLGFRLISVAMIMD